MHKRGNYIFVIALILVLSLSLVSAGWFANILGKITGNAQFTIPDSPTGQNNNGDSHDSSCDYVTDSMRQAYYTFFDGNGWSTTFNSHAWDGKSDTETIASVKERYGLQEFDIQEVEYFYDKNSSTGPICVDDLVKIDSGTCDNCLGDIWIRVKVDPKCFISSQEDNSGDFPVEEVGLLEEKYTLVCDSVSFADNVNHLYFFSLSGEPTLTNKLNISTNYNPVSYKEKTYVISTESLIAFNELGQEVWRYETNTNGEGGIFYQPIIDENTGTLYVGSSNGFLFSINLKESETGAVLNWFKKYSGNVELNSIAYDSLYLIAGNTSKSILLINRADGNKILSYTDERGLSFPFIYENKVVLSGESEIAVFELATMNLIWEEKFSRAVSPVFVDKGIVYFGTSDSTGGFYAMNISSKEYLFSRVGGANSWPEARANPEHFFKTISTQPIIKGEVIYFTGSGGTLFALNKSGYKIWYYSIRDVQRAEVGGDYVYLSSPNVGDDYITFFGGKANEIPKLYVVNKLNGAEISVFNLEGQSNLLSNKNFPISVCRQELVTVAPNGKVRPSESFINRLIEGWRNLWSANPELPSSSQRNAWDVLPSTGCEIDSGNCVQLENGNWVCDRKFCTLYQTTFENGIPNGGILIPNLDSLKLISTSNGVAKMNLTYSKKEILLTNGQKVSIGSNGLGILITKTGNNYIVFQVGKMEELGGSLTSGNDGDGEDNKLSCVDSDGKSYEIYGWVNFTEETLVGGNNYMTDSYVDRCIEGVLYEAYCSGILPQIETHSCEYGCATDGKSCKKSDTSGICSDPDLLDSFTKSTTQNKTASGSIHISKIDVCSGTQVLEYYCDGLNVKSQLIDCEFGCENGACKQVKCSSTQIFVDGICKDNKCIEYDQVKDYFHKSKISDAYGTEEDSCNGNVLTEWYCEENLKKSIAYSCPLGYECVVGACEKVRQCSIASECGIDNYVEGSLYTCDESNMNVVRDYRIWSCTDEICSSTIVKQINASCSYSCENGVCLGKVDSCLIDNDCAEGLVCRNGVCLGGSGDTCLIKEDCNVGEYCNNGVCFPYTENDSALDCTDTDINTEFADGKNIYLKGTATEPLEAGGLAYIDKCSSDKNSVTEYFCGVDDRVKSWNYNCEAGCENGACKIAQCSNSNKCAGGKVCDNGVCKTGNCLTDNDCPSGQKCENQFCKGVIANPEIKDCADDDSHQYQLKFGTLYISWTNGTVQKFYDSCVGESLKQYQCNGPKNYNSSLSSCGKDFFCQEGICLATKNCTYSQGVPGEYVSALPGSIISDNFYCSMNGVVTPRLNNGEKGCSINYGCKSRNCCQGTCKSDWSVFWSGC